MYFLSAYLVQHTSLKLMRSVCMSPIFDFYIPFVTGANWVFIFSLRQVCIQLLHSFCSRFSFSFYSQFLTCRFSDTNQFARGLYPAFRFVCNRPLFRWNILFTTALISCPHSVCERPIFSFCSLCLRNVFNFWFLFARDLCSASAFCLRQACIQLSTLFETGQYSAPIFVCERPILRAVCCMR